MKLQFKNITVILAITVACHLGPAFAGCAGGGSSMKGYTPPSPSAKAALELLNPPTGSPPVNATSANPAPAATTPTPVSATTTAPKITPATGTANTPTTEPPIAGKVVWTKGTLKVVGADKKIRILQPGSPIYPEDTIVTDGKSQAQVAFTDHTMVTLDKSTVFNVTKYDYKPETKSGSVGTYIMNLIVGSFRTMTGNIAKANPADYQVNTEVAVMGVRGTDYGAAYGSCSVKMKFYQGTPILTNSKGTITLTQAAPFGVVNDANAPPITVKVEPAVFKNTLPLISASIESIRTMPPLKIIDNKDPGSSSGGSGGACKSGSGGNGFNAKFR